MTSTVLKQSEKQFQAAVMELARMLGWRVGHIHDSRREVTRKDGGRLVIGDKDAAGLPDLLMVRGDRVIAAELKSEKGKPTREQGEWLVALRRAGVGVALWRPSDWPQIEEALR